MNSLVHLKGIAYELGDLVPINTLKDFQSAPDLLKYFVEQGLQSYSRANCSPALLAYRACSKALDAAGLRGEDIDAIIYGTTSFYREDFYHKDIGKLLTKLRLQRAYPIAVSLSECANIITSIRLAKSLILTEKLTHILVVATDVRNPDESRIVAPNISVYSDAASACVVSSSTGDYSILASHQNINMQLWDVDSTSEPSKYFLGMSQGIHRVCEKLYSIIERGPQDFAQLCPNHYNLNVSNTLSFQTKFKPDQIYKANIHRFAHAYSADPLINLCDFSNSVSLPAGSLCFLLGTGPSTWGGIVISKN